MKIAIVSGDDLVTDEPQHLCSALAARGEEVTAYVRRPGLGTADPSTGGYPTLCTAVGPAPGAASPDVLPYIGEWAAAFERAWTAEPPDVVHAYGWLGGLAAQLAARRLRLPTVQSFLGLAAMSHSCAQPETERERVERLLARSATRVTGESSTDVDALARLRRGRFPISTLTSGVDVERFTPVGPALAGTDLHRVVCLARDPLPANGFDIVIRAMPKVPDAELIVAETGTADPGHDEARSRLRELAEGLGVADRVRIAGSVADDELPMLVRSADVLACTPRHPPRSTSVLQAMASGVVVVARPVGILGDVVIDNVTGLLLSPQRALGLAAALRSLLAQNFRRQSMGSAGRSLAVSRFAWNRIALDALNIYRRLGADARRGDVRSVAAGGRVVP